MNKWNRFFKAHHLNSIQQQIYYYEQKTFHHNFNSRKKPNHKIQSPNWNCLFLISSFINNSKRKSFFSKQMNELHEHDARIQKQSSNLIKLSYCAKMLKRFVWRWQNTLWQMAMVFSRSFYFFFFLFCEWAEEKFDYKFCRVALFIVVIVVVWAFPFYKRVEFCLYRRLMLLTLMVNRDEYSSKSTCECNFTFKPIKMTIILIWLRANCPQMAMKYPFCVKVFHVYLLFFNVNCEFFF